MRRSRLFVAGAIWSIAVVVLIVLLATGLMPHLSRAYCAAWLLLVSLPLGALPVLMLLDLIGVGEIGLSGPLRLLLSSLPILAILIVPILLDYGQIYVGSSSTSMHGFGARWFSRDFFILRAVVYLVVWIVLALFFVRPEPPRPAVAGFGLFVHAVVGTLAAYDWFMSLDAGFVSSTYGLLVIAAQAALAITVAGLLSLVTGRRTGPDREVVLALLVVVGAAAFVQFAQYLVIWSANLPNEIIWYQARASDILGPIFSIGAPLFLAAAVIVLLPERFGMRRAPMTIALAALCVVEGVDIIMLASPGDGFTFWRVLVDLMFGILLAGLAAAGAVVVAGRFSHGARHG